MKSATIEKIQRSVLYQEFANKIRSLIEEENLWGQQLAADKDLAEAFGVSRDTARKGLLQLERDGVVTRRQGQLTRVNPRPASDVRKEQGRFLVCMYEPGGHSIYHDQIIRGFVEQAGETAWLTTFCNSANPDGRAELDAALKSGEIDALMLLNEKRLERIEEIMKASSVPVVAVDFHFEDLPITSVMDDSEGGTCQAVEHLIALGHRRIGFLGPPRRALNPWRFNGYVKALERAGIELDENLVVPSDYGLESGMQACETLLGLPNPPSAVFAFEDSRAWGVWQAAEDHGLKVGKDFALVGYGDNATLTGFGDRLSSVSYRPGDLGRAAAKALLDEKSGREQRGRALWMPTQLTVRESSKNAYGPAWDS